MPRMVKRSKELTFISNSEPVVPDPLRNTLAISTTTGLLGLPVELFEMVLSDFADISTEHILHNPTPFPKSAGERIHVLRALSQTCRALRASCLPRAWERLEACIEHTEGAWYKQVSANLERKCRGLTKTPELAKLVRIATVTLTRCSACSVLSAFTDCLAILPNLHTLQIVHAHSQMTTPLKGHFEGKSFPQIRTIILPSCAHNILRACPEVRSVTCNEDDGSKLVSAIKASCKKVEAVSGIRPERPILKRLVKAAPNLQKINITACEIRVAWNKEKNVPYDDIRFLSNFKKLRTIVLTVGEEGKQAEYARTSKPHVTAARDALKESSAQDKEVVVQYSQCTSPRYMPNRRWEPVRVVRLKV